jgi:hypothetical protein
VNIRLLDDGAVMYRKVFLNLEVEQTTDEQKVSFLVTRASLELWQRMKDPELAKAANELAPHVVAKSGHKMLAGIEGKRISFAKKDDSWELALDETSENKLIGPLAPLLLYYRESKSGKITVLFGMPIRNVEAKVIDRKKDYHLRLFSMHSAKGKVLSYEADIRKEKDPMPLFSKIVLGEREGRISEIVFSNSTVKLPASWEPVRTREFWRDSKAVAKLFKGHNLRLPQWTE